MHRKLSSRWLTVLTCFLKYIYFHSSYGTQSNGQSSTSHQLPVLDSPTPRSSVTNNALLPNLDPSVPPPSVHPSLQTAQLIPSCQTNSIVVTAGLNSSITSPKAPRRVRLWDEERRRATLLADSHTDVVESVRHFYLIRHSPHIPCHRIVSCVLCVRSGSSCAQTLHIAGHHGIAILRDVSSGTRN